MFIKSSLLLSLWMFVVAADAGYTVHGSVERNDLEEVAQFIQQGGAINQANRFDEHLLHLARTPEMIELLIKGGAEVNIENHFGDSPLLQAVYRGHHGLVELLIEYGADLNHKNRFGDTPLREAVNRDLIVMAKLLIERGAELDAQSKSGDTVLHTAVRRGNRAMVRVLVQGGAKMDIENEDGHRALDLALGRGMKSELTIVRGR